MNKCLVFDVFGDFACFKKHYTTSSPLTFDFPPKTALAGMIGAIIGLDFNQKYDIFKGVIGLKVLSAGRKVYAGINWIDTKPRDAGKFRENPSNVAFLEAIGLPPKAEIGVFTGMTWPGKENRSTQINIEILVDPKYRIYYPDTNPHFQALKTNVEEHKAVYSIFLGISEFIANFEHIDIATIEEITDLGSKEVIIDSVIPVLDPETFHPAFGRDGTDTFIDRLPRTMIQDRRVTDYTSFVYTLNSAQMQVRVPLHHHIKGSKVDDNILFF